VYVYVNGNVNEGDRGAVEGVHVHSGAVHVHVHGKAGVSCTCTGTRTKETGGPWRPYTFTAERYTFTYTGKRGHRVRERGRPGGGGHTFLVKKMRKTGDADGPVRGKGNRLAAGVREGSVFRVKREAGESGARASTPATTLRVKGWARIH